MLVESSKISIYFPFEFPFSVCLFENLLVTNVLVSIPISFSEFPVGSGGVLVLYINIVLCLTNIK